MTAATLYCDVQALLQLVTHVDRASKEDQDLMDTKVSVYPDMHNRLLCRPWKHC